MINYIDEEEKEIIESLHKEGWEPNLNKDLNKVYEEYARNSYEFKNSIEIKLTDKDMKKIQLQAMQEGIPFQNLISMLVHKFNEGKVLMDI